MKNKIKKKRDIIKMRIAYLDDDKTQLDTLIYYLKQVLSADVLIDTFTNSESFFETFSSTSYDIIFLDIFLNNETGIDIAHKIRKTNLNIPIAFCTTSNDFASESYDLNAKYYLQKPFTKEKIDKMLIRINLEEIEKKRIIHINDVPILIHNILYTEYESHIAIIHKVSGDKIRLKITQAELVNILCQYNFFISTSKGIIVNLYYVKNVSKDIFVLNTGDLVPISRRRKKETLEAYNNFKFDQMRKNDVSILL